MGKAHLRHHSSTMPLRSYSSMICFPIAMLRITTAGAGGMGCIRDELSRNGKQAANNKLHNTRIKMNKILAV